MFTLKHQDQQKKLLPRIIWALCWDFREDFREMQRQRQMDTRRQDSWICNTLFFLHVFQNHMLVGWDQQLTHDLVLRFAVEICWDLCCKWMGKSITMYRWCSHQPCLDFMKWWTDLTYSVNLRSKILIFYLGNCPISKATSRSTSMRSWLFVRKQDGQIDGFFDFWYQNWLVSSVFTPQWMP